MKKRLLVGISSHGFGHFAMTAPIINQLLHEDKFEIILRTQVPRFLIESRLQKSVEIIEEAADFGMKMNSSLDVDVAASLQAYIDVHSNWDSVIQLEMSRLRSIRPSLILANIPYVTLAAAAKLGIPALAYSSLNWAEITTDYFRANQRFVEYFIPQMNAAYNSALQFICPEPCMAMPALDNVVKIGPVCGLGNNLKDQILERFTLSAINKLVVITAGGVATNIPVESWPRIDGIVWLCAWNGQSDRKDIIYQSQVHLPFRDLMASADIVVTKPGYGMVSESVCHGKPALFVRRSDWAEEPYLIEWWQTHGLVKEISREQFFNGKIGDELIDLMQKPRFPPLAPTGIQQGINIINQFL